MPKISNKGFGFIPILVLSLLIGLVALAGYKMRGQDKVLNESTQYAQIKNTFPSTIPGNLIKIRLGYTETSGYKNGKITLRISLNNDKVGALGELNAYIKKYGLVVEDYCMAAVCPRPRIVKPSLTFVERPTEMYLQGEIPVTGLVKSVSLSNPVNIDPKVPPFSFENNLEEWDLRLSAGNRKFSIIRKNEKTTVGIDLISKLPNGQETYQVYINGVGDDSAELIKSMRTSGIRKMDLVGNNLRTTAVKPLIGYSFGQGRFTITALPNTRTFYVTPSRKLNVSINPMPDGWVLNKNGDGVDRVATPEKPAIVDITFIRNIGNQQEFEVSIIGRGQPLEDLIRVLISGIKRVDLIGNQSRTTTLNIIPFKTQLENGDSKLSLRVLALPTTRTFYVNSSKKDIKAVPGRLPAGWKLNNNKDGLDRIIK